MCLLPSLKWSSTVSSLGIVQWDFTRRDHPENPRRVSGSGPVKYPCYQKTEIEKMVQELLQSALIRLSHNPFSSPVLLVKKMMELDDFV